MKDKNMYQTNEVVRPIKPNEKIVKTPLKADKQVGKDLRTGKKN